MNEAASLLNPHFESPPLPVRYRVGVSEYRSPGAHQLKRSWYATEESDYWIVETGDAQYLGTDRVLYSRSSRVFRNGVEHFPAARFASVDEVIAVLQSLIVSDQTTSPEQA